MLINGIEWGKDEIKKQIKFISENIKYNQEQLKKWKRLLREEERINENV